MMNNQHKSQLNLNTFYLIIHMSSRDRNCFRVISIILLTFNFLQLYISRRTIKVKCNLPFPTISRIFLVTMIEPVSNKSFLRIKRYSIIHYMLKSSSLFSFCSINEVFEHPKEHLTISA